MRRRRRADAPTVTTSGSDDYATFRRELRRAALKLRRPLPWIGHPDPWAILVSEIMLQQTQVPRVLVPWAQFLERFASPTACADAPLSSVVRLWAGLGYHRRAKALHDTARMIRDEYGGTLPREVAELRRLPGVGEYTANAVASFAYGQPVAVVDTNVGRILARALANRRLRTTEARDLAQELLPRRASAAFNQAMLDLGAQFCKSVPLCAQCPVAAACRWRVEGGPDPAPRSAGVSRPQSTFEGSDRQLRGRVLEALRHCAYSTDQLFVLIGEANPLRGHAIVNGLIRDGLVEQRGRAVRLAGHDVAVKRPGTTRTLDLGAATDITAGGDDR